MIAFYLNLHFWERLKINGTISNAAFYTVRFNCKHVTIVSEKIVLLAFKRRIVIVILRSNP